MEDNMFIKPGNQERGWNDPPQFSYGLQTQTAQGPKRNLLNKRVPPPQLTGQSPPRCVPPAPPTSNPLAPPPCGTTPPRPLQAHPPCSMMTLSPCAGGSSPPMGQVKPLGDDSQSETEPDVEEVVSVLNWAVGACRHSVKGHVCDEVVKRVRVLEDSWRSGRLSLPVRRRMSTLAQELRSGHWDAADEIHRSLMVDHVTEVSQWLVGIKRLIAETRNLTPELLELGQKAEEPEQNPGELNQSPEQASEGSPHEITPAH